jgi:isoleucyl-tRNA synthetase
VTGDFVSTDTGTGIVHIAPGCGKEDFYLGKAERLVAIGPLDESGLFLPGFGELENRAAIDPAAQRNWKVVIATVAATRGTIRQR